MTPPHKNRNNILVIAVRNKEVNFHRRYRIGFLKWNLGNRKTCGTRELVFIPLKI
jgi:hypothetical protein